MPLCVLQLDRFRDLVFEARDANTTTKMVDTYRPVQPVGSRVVYSSTGPDDHAKLWEIFGLSSASSVKLSASLLCLIFAFLLF